MLSVNAATVARLLGNWRAGRGPGYAQLATGLRQLVLDGRLALATRLPSERELAPALGVSRTTVTAAYATLRDAGFAQSRQGAGTWTTLPERRGPVPGVSTPDLFGDATAMDLTCAAPSAPEEALHAAFVDALTELPRYLPGHGYEVLGMPALRAAVAERYTARGLTTTADQVLITSGAQQAISLVMATLTQPGDRLLVENPTYPNALEFARRSDLRLVGVPLMEDGWDIDAFAAALRQTSPRLAYLVPDFHNPTGLLMPPADRTRLARLLARSRTPVVIDETLAELPLDGQEMPLPLGADVPDAGQIHVGTASKAFWGGLGVGWLRATPEIVRRIAARRALHEHGTAVLEQLTVARLLADADPILAARRLVLARHRDALVAAVTKQLPHWRVRVPGGGLVLWCDIGAPVSGPLVAAAEAQGLRLATGAQFGAEGGFDRWLRLPYTLPEDTLTTAVARLATAETALGTAGPVRDDLARAVVA